MSVIVCKGDLGAPRFTLPHRLRSLVLEPGLSVCQTKETVNTSLAGGWGEVNRSAEGKKGTVSGRIFERRKIVQNTANIARQSRIEEKRDLGA